ncbi:siderophore-interacting protein [Pelagicoccus albus]|uniref:Siderophore-interacting protein n=1 Tax=Pelagicoccus albus TaxID=415222 RepID=A0A7X1EA39_9BACT|nr:siderophore-interacting protein [Pelagicoccus albus]MBC2607863.1 siderophore-interacting protein [Pelagicoccus albus]
MGQDKEITKVSYELKKRSVAVKEIQKIGANTLGIRFGGESLAGFRTASFDDHIKLFLETTEGERLGRHYTVRDYDPENKELTIEFGTHSTGPAARWASNAVPGDVAEIGGPKGSRIIPTNYDWHLLIGDNSSLPAIHRRVEELPSWTKAIVLVTLPDPADRRNIKSDADVSFHWIQSEDILLHKLKHLPLPAGEGVAWCAGEQDTITQVESILLKHFSMPKENVFVKPYWKRDKVKESLQA